MTPDMLALVTAVKLADSQFPSGAFGFSWGMETLTADGMLHRGRLVDVLRAELDGRWAMFDRVFMHRSLLAESNRQRIVLDREIEAMSWSEAARIGSKRAGAGLLMIHRKLDTTNATEMYQSIRRGEMLGHFPVIQGAMFQALALPPAIAGVVSGYGFLSGLGSAAVRLGLAGAVEVQLALQSLAPRLATLAAETPPLEASCFSPLFEIAMMRHSSSGIALFSN